MSRSIRLVCSVVVTALCATLFGLTEPQPASAVAPGWEVTRITANTYDDLDPRVGDGLVVWTADPGGTGDRDVFWLRLGEPTIHRVQMVGDDFDAVTSQGRIAWVTESPYLGPENIPWEVWLLDTNLPNPAPTRLDEASTNAAGPAFDGSRLFWAGWGVVDNDIFMYDAATGGPRVNISGGLPSGPSYEYRPVVDGDMLAWEAWMGPGDTSETVLYDLDTQTYTRITDNSVTDLFNAISGDRLTYYDNGTGDVYLYDASNPGAGSMLLSGGPGAPHRPRISARGVVFDALESTWLIQLYRFDTQALTTLTGAGTSGIEPAADGDLVAWQGWPAVGGGSDIYVASFPGLAPVNLSTRPGVDSKPYVKDGMVVWLGDVGGTKEVFFARYTGEAQQTFTDVPPSHPYSAAIEGMARDGIINGYHLGEGIFEFRPGNNVLRAQFAKIIVGAMGLPVSEQTALPPFTDLGPDKQDDLYPHEYVATAYANRITFGTTATTFGPYKDITRAQLLSMVVRAVKELMPASLVAPPPAWTGQLPSNDPTHGGNIRLAEANGLLDGVPVTGWNVWAKASRGEAAQILWNLTKLGS